MAGNDAQASFGVNLDSNAADVAGAAAQGLEELRARIQGAKDAVGQMSGAMRSLRGSTSEVKAAKEQLKARIDAERDAVSASTLALLKQGTTYEKLTADARKLAAEQEKLRKKLEADQLKKSQGGTEGLAKAVHATGGPVSVLTGKLEGLHAVLGKTGIGTGLVVAGVAGLVAGLAALVAGVVGAGLAFARFVVEGANAARALALVREAAAGSADNARRLGDQVDVLARKVPTSKDELTKLSTALLKTRLSGQAIVDTFNAVSQASSAMGGEVGAQLQGIITRGQMAQRIQINPLELQGSGLQFTDIAAALAKQMNVGIDQARRALFEGRVKLDDGAKAIRTAVEKRFGDINLRKMLDLNVQSQKFHENLVALTSGVSIEPLLRSVAELAKLFDTTTVTGASLKQIITIVGNDLAKAFVAATPIAKAFLQGLVIGGLDVLIGFYKLKNAITTTFGKDAIDGALVLKVALQSIHTLALAVESVFSTIRNDLEFLRRLGVLKGDAVQKHFGLVGGTGSAADVAAARGAASAGAGTGEAMTRGLDEGFRKGGAAAKQSAADLANGIKGGFADTLQIHSPSKVFERFGQQTAEGYAQGLEGGSAGVNAASLAPRPGRVAGAGGAAGGVTVNVAITVYGGAGGAAQDTAKELAAPSFLGPLTKAIEDALRGAGIPTGAPVPP